ncbi:MAG: SLBB domain-containing protein [Gammaproteobacteria bacterium]
MKRHYKLAMKYLNILIALCVALCASAYAFTPTPEQIEQFKQLPRAEQERLAREYGVDLHEIVPARSTQPLAVEPVQVMQDSRRRVEPAVSEPAHGDIGTASKKLRLFGYDLFENNAAAFQPAIDIPVPADYVVGPGDTFVVQLYGKENANYSLTVTREGVVQFPEIGPISLAGLKFSQAQSVIEQTISEQMIGVKSAVTMGTLRTIRVFVLGEAVQPGSYVVGSLSTMTNALFASGGVTEIGSLRNIQLKRQGQVITTLDLYDLLLKGDTRNDARLLPGDVIFIPPQGKTVGIDGEVRRPAIYEIKQERTFAEAIALAGGLLPTAYAQASRVERINDQGERTVLDVDLASAKEITAP